jgi:HSP20 family molecular chaperone IbpA
LVSIAFSTSLKPHSAPARTIMPPYNIERLADDRYQISLAVAGFSPDEITVTAEQNVVTIEGSKADKMEREYLYRAFPHVPSSASSTLPTMCRRRARRSRMACSESN